MMAVFSFLGVLMAFVIGRHRAMKGTLDDAAAAAAAVSYTLPTSATAGAGRSDGRRPGMNDGGRRVMTGPQFTRSG